MNLKLSKKHWADLRFKFLTFWFCVALLWMVCWVALIFVPYFVGESGGGQGAIPIQKLLMWTFFPPIGFLIVILVAFRVLALFRTQD